MTAARERIGCKTLILACNGFGGNPDLVRRFIPEMAGALYFGHPGNRGDAVMWGEALGAKLAHLGAYQGHGSVATPHNILITWAVIMQGGIQINRDGSRFCDETQGYSEQAAEVLRQPGAIAWSVFDARIAAVARQFEDFQNAERAGAILTGRSVEELAGLMRVPAATFAAEWADVESLKRKRGDRSLRASIRAGTALRGAVPCGQGHRRLVSHPRRPRHRRRWSCQAQGRDVVAKFICGRRSGGGRIGLERGRLSVRQRPFDRNRAWPSGGTGRSARIALANIAPFRRVYAGPVRPCRRACANSPAMATAAGVSEWTQTVVALTGMSRPAVVLTTCSRITRKHPGRRL